MPAIIAVVLVVGGGSATAVCHFTSVDCHIGTLFFSKQSTAQEDQKLINSLKSGRVTGVFADGLSSRVALTGFTEPTDFSFITRNAVLVGEKRGVVWEANFAKHTRRIILDLRPETSVAYFRGLMTVAADPNFARNHFFYVLYSTTNGKATSSVPTTVTLTRYTLRANRAAGQPRVLLGRVRSRSCSTLPADADCIPADLDHLGAQIVFAADGTLFVSTGDGGGYDTTVEKGALRAQDLSSLGGKVLHITHDGLGIPSNPFFDGKTTDNRSKVWASGLRNPFRLARDPLNGMLVTGDVGAHRFDEIDVVRRGANLGWPCYEADAHHPPYASTRFCKTFYARSRNALTWPVKALWARTVVIGGTFLSKTLASDVGGSYVFASLGHGWLRTLSFSRRGLSATTHVLAQNLPGPVAIHTSPAGDLYVLCLGSGDLLRISGQS